MRYWRKPLDSDKIKTRHGKVHILTDRCKGCGLCVEFCTKKALELSKEYNAKGYHPPYVKDPEACMGCNMCSLICPDFGIWIDSEDDSSSPKPEKDTAKKGCC